MISRIPSHDVPDELWQRIEPLLPKEKPKPNGGRPAVAARKVLAGVLYRLRTGCPWKALGKEFGSGATCHRRFAAWCRGGVFRQFWKNMLVEYDQQLGIGLDWTSLDSATVKAPKGGDQTGPNPTDRAKSGCKRHLLTDRRGVPLALEISGANVHDKWLVAKVLDGILLRGARGPRRPRHLCLDKGYDYPDAEYEVRRRRVQPHIRRQGQKPRSRQASALGRRENRLLAQPVSCPARAVGTHGFTLRRPL